MIFYLFLNIKKKNKFINFIVIIYKLYNTKIFCSYYI